MLPPTLFVRAALLRLEDAGDQLFVRLLVLVFGALRLLRSILLSFLLVGGLGLCLLLLLLLLLLLVLGPLGLL